MCPTFATLIAVITVIVGIAVDRKKKIVNKTNFRHVCNILLFRK